MNRFAPGYVRQHRNDHLGAWDRRGGFARDVLPGGFDRHILNVGRERRALCNTERKLGRAWCDRDVLVQRHGPVRNSERRIYILGALVNVNNQPISAQVLTFTVNIP